MQKSGCLSFFFVVCKKKKPTDIIGPEMHLIQSLTQQLLVPTTAVEISFFQD